MNKLFIYPRIQNAITRFLLIIALFLMSQSLWAQASGDYRSAATGNWGTAATWETFSGGTWIAAGTPPTSANGVITIRSPHVVTVAAGVSVDQVVVSSGGQVTVNSGITVTIANGTGTDFDVSGTLRNAGAFTLTGTMAFQSGGKYEHNYTTAQGVIPTASWNANSTCEILGYTSNPNPPTGLGQTFGNFTWNCPLQTGNINLSGALTTVAGNFTMGSTGTVELRLTGTGDFTLAITGNYVQTGGTLNPANGNNGTATININGNFSKTGGSIIQSGGNPNTSGEFVFVKTGTQTFANTGTISGFVNFTVNSGSILEPSTNIIIGNGFTLASGGTLNIASTAGITSAGATGTVQTSIRTFSTGGNYTYNGAASQVTGNGLPASVNNLTLINLLGLTLSQNATVNGTLLFSSGKIATSTNKVTIGSLGSISGAGITQYINGNLEINIGAAVASKNFEIGDATNYTPVLVAFTGTTVAGGSILANTTGSDHPNISTSGILPSKSVNRYWTLTNTGVTGFTSYTATLNFSASDIDGGAATGSFIIKRFNAATWNTTTTGTLTATSSQASVSGTVFGDFQVGESCFAPALSSSVTNVTCPGGSNGAIDLTVTGGTAPFTYLWTGGATTQDISGLTAGTYKVVVSTNGGCKDSITLVVTEPPVINIAETHISPSCNVLSDGSIDITVSGGTPPYTYSWNTGATTEDISG
ncbi:MAG: beta strand repeat-containing protein, partial [Chitinophagales bacterium]